MRLLLVSTPCHSCKVKYQFGEQKREILKGKLTSGILRQLILYINKITQPYVHI